MSPSGASLKKGLIFVHRWMGVCFCLLFLLWFTSGMAMMYWDYPEVTRADRLARGAELDGARIRISPEDAFSRLQSSEPPDRVRLNMFDGRPVYRFDFRGDQAMVDADDGERQSEFPPATTLRIAAAWAGRPPEEAKEQDNLVEDQWTVSGEFQELRPIREYAWADGQEVYVSTVTGEVVQHTTRTSRLGAYIGPIPHWLYFTPLRRRAELWSSVVIWASGLATGIALLGSSSAFGCTRQQSRSAMV